MWVDLTRGILFTRAFTRVCTVHPDVKAAAASRVEFARLTGEFVSLLALVYLAERAAEHTNPWTPLMGAVFAFLLPTLVLRDRVFDSACASLGVERSVRNHVLLGVVGVFLCYALYEAVLKAVELVYDSYGRP